MSGLSADEQWMVSGSRGPTPFQPRDSRDFTPYISPREALAAANSAHPWPSSSSPPPAAKCMRTASPSRMGTASPPPEEARARRLYKKLATYLDTTAADSDEENDPQDGEEEEEELHDSDIEVIDDTPPQLQTDQLWTFDDDDDDDTDTLRTAPATIPRPPPAKSLARQRFVIARTLSPSANVRPAPHNETLRGMERRLRSALPNPGEVVRGSWIRFQGELVFVLGPKELLMKRVDAPPPPPRSQNPKAEETPDPCQPRQVGTKLSAQKYPQVDPAIDELTPFRGTCCRALLCWLFAGPSQAIEAGDHVLLVAGERHGEAPYILEITELSARGQLKRVCRLTPNFPHADQQSFVYPLNQMVRHILSPAAPLHILDRVRVNCRPVYRGLSGRITSLDGSQISVALASGAEFDEKLPSKLQADGIRIIEVSMEHVNRYFLPGDLVVVVRGDRKNLHGLVVEVHSDGGLDSFTTRDGREVLEDFMMGPGEAGNQWIVKRHKTGCFDLVDHQNNPDALAQTVHVMKADVDFLMFDEENFAANRPLHQYTMPSVVTQHLVNPPTLSGPGPAKTLAYRRQTQADNYAVYEAESQANQAVTRKMIELEPPTSFAELHQRIIERDRVERDRAASGLSSSLSHSGVEYSNIYVLVGFKHPNKGFRGQVIRTYNTKERSEHLKSQQASGQRRRYLTGDTKGIMVTIRSHSNQEINVPIENVVHDLTRLRLAQAQYLPSRESDPEWGLRSSTEEEQQHEKERLLQEQQRKSECEEQRLPGERDGTWLRIAGLVGKRLDVTMEGVQVLFERVASLEESVEEDDCTPEVRLYAELHLEDARKAWKKEKERALRLQRTLGIDDSTALKKLAHSQYYSARMSAKIFKEQLQEKLRDHKFELDPIERSFSRTRSENQRNEHAGAAINHREPNIARLVKSYSQSCVEIKALIDTKKAPKGAIAPIPVPAKGIYQLDVDDAIWQDLGLDGDEQGVAPLWLSNEKVRAGIRALLQKDRCKEEAPQLAEGAEAFANVVCHQVEGGAIQYQFQLRHQELLQLCVLWKKSLDQLAFSGKSLPEWGPTREELLGCQIAEVTASWGDGYDSDSDDGMDDNEDDDLFQVLTAVERADNYRGLENDEGETIWDDNGLFDT
ncbi:hypothetical protein DFH09DRAFT_1305273 [Mycena vulgaris]|nr:hypothetical protein DFH09DRAFT_1305273 [Mycena vulgaris]